jgi:hypothetical protein
MPDRRIPGDDGGPRNGELCVVKEFKTGSVFEASFFETDLKTVSKAGRLVEAFNNENIVSNRHVYLNKPKVWKDVNRNTEGKRKKYLVEPMLEGQFLKFNNNSGYVNRAYVMQALSHFSYRNSGGKFLLCDLQGGRYMDAYILTDPVIMSTDNSKVYGPTDLGSEGVDNFFARHVCNQFCKIHWLKPLHSRVSLNIPCRKGTSMSLSTDTLTKTDAERKAELATILASSKMRR